jgi:hypothetical protein
VLSISAENQLPACLHVITVNSSIQQRASLAMGCACVCVERVSGSVFGSMFCSVRPASSLQ